MATSNTAKIVKSFMSNKRNTTSSDYYTGLDYAMNMESAKQQMNFQAFMSNTAHQREVQDLIKAGLNPILSANAGASSPVGAFADVDTSSVSAKAENVLQKKLLSFQYKQQLKNDKSLQKTDLANQRKMLEKQLQAQIYMNKYSNDLGYELGIAQAGISAGAMTTAAAYNAAAARYGADQARIASQYASDLGLTNSREQRAYDNLHPSNGWQAGGSAIYSLIDAFKNRGNSYFPGDSSAK